MSAHGCRSFLRIPCGIRGGHAAPQRAWSNLSDVQTVLGHKSLATTALYTARRFRTTSLIGRKPPAALIVYEDIATKFFEHFLHIAEAMNDIGEAGIGLWDEEDEFYYDVLNLPNGSMIPLKVRSMVGLIPLFAVEVLEPESLEEAPEFAHI